MTSLALIKLENKLFGNVVEYQNCRLTKKSSWCDDDDANELSKMTKKATLQMKDRTFSGGNPTSITAF